MPQTPARVLFVLLCLLTGCTHKAEPWVVRVTPGFSLAAARDQIRASRLAGETRPAVIEVPAGRHEISQALILDQRDSNLTLRAARDATPVLVGGSVVTGFKPYKGEIVQADVSALLKKGQKATQVLLNGQRMILARYPNFDPANPLYGGWLFVQPFPGGSAPEGHDWRRQLFMKPAEARNWQHPEDVEINIFAQYGWWNFWVPVQSVDPATGVLTLAKPCGYDLHPHNRFHFQNALEELDSPGEWFVDPRTQTLYLWPTAPLASSEVRLVTLDSFIAVQKGARNIRIEGLSFTGCNNAAIKLEGAEDCIIERCTLDTVGHFNTPGIWVSGGKTNAVRSCEITRTGSTGIFLVGGDRITLTPAGHEASNNHIHDFGVFSKNAAGVWAMGVGHRVAHNHIHHGPRMGVHLMGNDITVEYNHLHHLCLETQDGGAIYTGGRDWTGGNGCVWRYNHIHDIIGVGQEAKGLVHPFFTFGLYADDNSGGIDMIGNLVYRVSRSPLHMHNAHHCLVQNNIFAFGDVSLYSLSGWHVDGSFFQQHRESMIKGYESVASEPAWKNRRGMAVHPSQTIQPDGTMMAGNVITRNILLSRSDKARLVDLRNASPTLNRVEKNLVWNDGNPIVTGLQKLGPDLGPAVLSESFDSDKVPPGWYLIHRPDDSFKLKAEQGALKFEAGTNATAGTPDNRQTTLRAAEVEVVPGLGLRAKIRARSSRPNLRVNACFGMFQKGEPYWQSQQVPLVLTSDWKEFEVVGRFLEPGQARYLPWMTKAWLRIDSAEAGGEIEIDEVRITRAKPLGSWQAWQAEGWDRGSLVADPLFVDLSRDDFRLRRKSPALRQLGFKPLPLDKMGIQEKQESRKTGN